MRERFGRVRTFLGLRKRAGEWALQQQVFQSRMADLDAKVFSLSSSQTQLSEMVAQSLETTALRKYFEDAIDTRVGGLQDGFVRLDQDLVAGLERLDKAQSTTSERLLSFQSNFGILEQILNQIAEAQTDLSSASLAVQPVSISEETRVAINGLQDGFARMDQDLVAVSEAFPLIDRNLVASLERIDKNIENNTNTITLFKRDLEALMVEVKTFEVDVQFFSDRIGRFLKSSK